MENENKEKKVILTDEELKEVAGGHVTKTLMMSCRDLPQYYCVQKEVCAWDKKKEICTWKIRVG